MARTKGILPISANLEPEVAAPLDGRSTVPFHSDLLDPTTFGAFAYKGMVVAVTEEGNEALRGVFELTSFPTTDPENWNKVGSGLPEGFEGRVETLENTIFHIELFEEVSILTGSLDIPEEGTLLLGEYGDGLDGLVLKLDSSGNIIEEVAITDLGELVTVDITSGGDYTLSDTPSSFPVGIIFQISVKLKDLDAVPLSKIVSVERVNTPKFKRVDLSSGTYTLTDVNNTIYACALNGGDVIINLPEVTSINEGDTCYIYIESTDDTHELIVNTAASQTIRGEEQKRFSQPFSGFKISAHVFGSPHWDVLTWVTDPVDHDDLAGLDTGDFQHLTAAEKTLATQDASESQTGLLSSTDWTTFDNKLDSDDLKTINGQSLVGEGDIEIEAGTDVYYSGVAERDIGGITTGQVFDSASMTEMWDALIKQELFPNLTNPSSNFTSNVTGFREIGAEINITFTSTFNRGSINPQYTADSPFRSGEANEHILTGTGLSNITSTDLTETVTINNYTVLPNGQSWSGQVSYDEGVQPKSSYDNDYESPLSAGTTSTTSRTITGVYPWFATTSNITTKTKQTLSSHTATFNQVNMVAESGSDKQAYWISESHNSVTGVQFFNTVSNQWEWIGGSKANSLTTFTTSSETIEVQGNNINYTKYTHNGALSGARQLRFYTN